MTKDRTYIGSIRKYLQNPHMVKIGRDTADFPLKIPSVGEKSTFKKNHEKSNNALKNDARWTKLHPNMRNNNAHKICINF